MEDVDRSGAWVKAESVELAGGSTVEGSVWFSSVAQSSLTETP